MIDDFGIKKKSKTIRETGAKWSQFGAVGETWGLVSTSSDFVSNKTAKVTQNDPPGCRAKLQIGRPWKARILVNM